MGRIDIIDGLRAAERFRRAKSRQDALRDTSGQSDAIMLDRRRTFMLASQRTFFESIIDGSDLLPIRYLEMGRLASRAVGRIHVPPTDGRGMGFATGFLVAPGLLMTNHHVLPSEAAASAATVTMDADDGIDGLPMTPRVFRLDPSRGYVADPNLDFAIVGVAARSTDDTPLAPFGYLRLQAMTGKIVRDEYATIIQHPNGRQKHIAARNNKVHVYVYDDDLTAEERAANAYLYYSTDTLRGSSGAPVFSDQWYVVALHRRGVPKTRRVGGADRIVRINGKLAADDDPDEVIAFEANEGVRISRILERLGDLATNGPASTRGTARRIHDSITAAAGAIEDGPFSLPARPYTTIPSMAGDRTPSGLEVVRRRRSSFPEELGYDPDFLHGITLPLPRPQEELRLELAMRTDDPEKFWLPFRHFSSMVHARRRMAAMVAVNISMADKPPGGMPSRPSWSYDPRIAEEHQPDDTIFSDEVQRGHLAAREYVYWGADEAEIKEADVHSFTLTNAVPQIDKFNGSNGEWFQLERLVVETSRVEGLRLTEFTGPIFRADDPEFDALRSEGNNAEFGTLIRVPVRFWKVIWWVEDGALKHRAFILDQRDELNAAAEDGGGLEMDFVTPRGVRKTTLRRIEQLTGLVFR